MKVNRKRPAVLLGLSFLGAGLLISIYLNQIELAKMLAVGIPPVLIKAFESEEKGEHPQV